MNIDLSQFVGKKVDIILRDRTICKSAVVSMTTNRVMVKVWPFKVDCLYVSGDPYYTKGGFKFSPGCIDSMDIVSIKLSEETSDFCSKVGWHRYPSEQPPLSNSHLHIYLSNLVLVRTKSGDVHYAVLEIDSGKQTFTWKVKDGRDGYIIENVVEWAYATPTLAPVKASN